MHDDAVYSAIDRKPKRVGGGELARVRYLRRRPEAALTVDRYSDDWTQLAWVQILGAVDVLEIDSEPQVLAALHRRYPAYRAEPPPGPLLRLNPSRLLCWRADQ